MIISRTPLRLSLAGGGTDMPEFYRRQPGAVINFGINKYVYVSVNDKFDGHTRMSYSITEVVHHPEQLKHDLAREILKHFGVDGIEITSVSDIPGEGSGLGSSSAFTVGMCKAVLKKLDQNLNMHPGVYADLAYQIEAGKCGHRVGKQDQYAAAYGNIHFYKFNPDESVTAELIPLNNVQRFLLERDLMLFWTGKTRKAQDILVDQARRLENNDAAYQAAEGIKALAVELYNDLKRGELNNIGAYLHESWTWKRIFSAGVSDEKINALYDNAMRAGAEGGKLCGAGGGGFLMMWVPPAHQRAVEKAVGLRRVSWKMVERGSEIIYNGEKDE